MNYLDLVQLKSERICENFRLPLAFESVFEEDTTRLDIETFAEVNKSGNIIEFQIKTVLENIYRYTDECPCNIEVAINIDCPVAKDEQFEMLMVNYQENVIKRMINSNSTDDLTEAEIQAFEQWDRKDLLQIPEDLKDVESYVSLSRWATRHLEQHIKKFIVVPE